MDRMKMCFKCLAVKPVDEFYAHPAMSDGHLGKCKECTKNDVKAHRIKNIERLRAYDRKRGNRQGPGAVREYRMRNPEKYAAHSALNNAIRDRRITKPASCSICGSGSNIVGHHDDYSKPLDVVWCCQACHKSVIHKAVGNAAV